jgi:hypothetical protein
LDRTLQVAPHRAAKATTHVIRSAMADIIKARRRRIRPTTQLGKNAATVPVEPVVERPHTESWRSTVPNQPEDADAHSFRVDDGGVFTAGSSAWAPFHRWVVSPADDTPAA